MTEDRRETWEIADAYERFIGRWSRLVSLDFLQWLNVPAGAAWLDVGCGTGALTAGILETCHPHSLLGVDMAEGFLAWAQTRYTDERLCFLKADAAQLPADFQYDAVVSGLVLNFVPDPQATLRGMVKVTASGGKVAAYVWDYAEGMQMLRHFWDVASVVSPEAQLLDEAKRFPLCQPAALAALWRQVGLEDVTVTALEVATTFSDFDDYWQPFLGGQGPAPTYLAQQSVGTQQAIRDRLQRLLAPRAGQPLTLTARAWAVQGRVPRSAAL